VLLTTLTLGAREARARVIVVGHDINTLSSSVAGTQEAAFAVNVATFLTADAPTKNLLLFESNPGDFLRNFAPIVLNALAGAGFSVTVTANYTTAFAGYDAIFVAQDYPTAGFLDNAALIDYVNGGGGVYLAGGVGPVPATEAAGWSVFLNHFGLEFAGTYNPLFSVPVSSAHAIFAGITTLRCGNGQYIIHRGTNPDAEIVQFSGSNGVYAVVNPSGAPRLVGLTLKKSLIAGCKAVTGTVALSAPAPAGGLVVSLDESLAAAAAPASVTIPEGKTSRTFKVKTTPVGVREEGTVSATYGATTLTKPLTVRPIGVQSISLTPNPVAGGNPVSGEVKLECKAAPASILVELGSTSPGVAEPAIPGVVIAQGAQTAPFMVTTADVAARATPKITAEANGITKSKKLTVTP
jgi:hypothetical protein